MFWKSQTLFQRIFISVFIPEILIFIGALYINYTDTKEVLEKQIDNQSKSIKLELKQVLVIQEWVLDLLETKLDERSQYFSNMLVNDIFDNTDRIADCNLGEIKEEIGMDPDLEEIYIINNEGEIINTSFKADLNLNLYKLGEEYKPLFERLKSTGEYHLGGFSEENKTKKIRKFSYIASKDKKYIIELGIYSKEAEKLLATISEKLDQFQKINESVDKVNIFLKSNNPLNLYSKDTLQKNERIIFSEVVKEKKDSTILDGTIQKEFKYFSAEGKEGVIIVNYDLSKNEAILQGIVNEAIVILFVSLLILLIVLFINVKGITFL